MKHYETELHLINTLLRTKEEEGSLELAEEARLLAALDYIRTTSCTKALAEEPTGNEESDAEAAGQRPVAGEALIRRLDYLVEMMAKVQAWQFDLAENQTVLRQEQRRVKKALDKRIPVADKGSFVKGLGLGLVFAPLTFSGTLGFIVIIMKLANWMNTSAAFLGSLILCAAVGLGIYTYAQLRDTKMLNFKELEETDDGYEFADWSEALNFDTLAEEEGNNDNI